MIPNNVLQARFFIQTPHGHASSTLYYAPAGSISGAFALDTEANGFHDLFGPLIANVISEEAILAGFYLRYVNAGVDIEAFSTSASVVGEVSGECLPDQDCIEIRRLTGLPGREKRGRIFMSGISEEFNDGGLLAFDGRAPFQTLAAQMGTDLTLGATWHARHWDRKNNTMVAVSQCKPVLRFVSRRDRAKGLPYQTI